MNASELGTDTNSYREREEVAYFVIWKGNLRYHPEVSTAPSLCDSPVAENDLVQERIVGSSGYVCTYRPQLEEPTPPAPQEADPAGDDQEPLTILTGRGYAEIEFGIVADT